MGNSSTHDNISKLENGINFDDFISNKTRRENARINQEKRLKILRYEKRKEEFNKIADKMIEEILKKIKQDLFTKLSDNEFNVQCLYIPKKFGQFQKLHCVNDEIIRNVNSEDTPHGYYLYVYDLHYNIDDARYVELENWFVNRFNSMFVETMKITTIRLVEGISDQSCICLCGPNSCSSRIYGYHISVNIELINCDRKN